MMFRTFPSLFFYKNFGETQKRETYQDGQVGKLITNNEIETLAHYEPISGNLKENEPSSSLFNHG